MSSKTTKKNPRRARKGRIQRGRLTMEDRLAKEAQRLAALLIVAPENGVTAPPALLSDPRLAIARQFWNDHAARLAALGTLDDLSRVNLAILAVYVAEFILAQDDVLDRGYSVRVKTISGDRMPRINPSVERRDHAAKMIIELGRHYGFTKLDRMNLQRLRRGAGAGPLFDNDQGQMPAADQAAPTQIEEDERAWEQLTKPTVRPN